MWHGHNDPFHDDIQYIIVNITYVPAGNNHNNNQYSPHDLACQLLVFYVAYGVNSKERISLYKETCLLTVHVTINL